MRPRDIALAVVVAAVWGCNFVAIETGLDRMPPLLFSTLRFAVAALPAIFFVGKPQVPWRWVISIGLVLGVVKFSLLFGGMAAGMPAGLSSLVLQSQAIFTVGFAFLFLTERPRFVQLAGLAVAAIGILLVAVRFGASGPLGAFLLVIGAAAAWGVSNVAMRKAAPPDMLRFMVWVSAVATLPLAVLSFTFEGVPSFTVDLPLVASIGYIAWVSTLAGFALWGILIRRNGAAAVAPFSMLVPFFGMTSAALFLGEPLHPTDLIAALLVIGGVLTPSFLTPSVRTPSVRTPSVRTPSVRTPSVRTPSVRTPSVRIPSVRTPSVRTPSVRTPSVPTPSVTAPSVRTLESHST
uniref:EamA family transporter n=1 Tax=Catelliglobosispora koreensis TaxID=129052 RepID=UPI00037421FC